VVSNNSLVAIIGMSCRFPGGSNSVQKFWENLKSGKDCVTEVPKDRWSIEEYYHNNEKVEGKTNSKCGGYIDHFDEFDAGFFGISEREAEQLDPQQRHVLEVTWEAFEDAGLKPSNYVHSKTGVFIGGFTLDYKIMQFADTQEVATHTAVGSMMTMLSNRISYVYDFRGPSMSIDTACSSSLVSMHEACMSLKNQECDMALAGGVEIICTPEYYVAESKGGFLSKDGRCKTFDASANGYVRSEGCGIVLLKRLEDAIADGDNIYAVVRGSLVNQDGHTNGITVPNGEAQESLLREAYERAGINPHDVKYVEVHGTGTEVGDPIEVNAVGSVFGKGRSGDLCTISSVKANIGHMEAASGMASVIKAVCILKNKQIVPQIGFHNLNPKLQLEEMNLRIPKDIEQFPETNGPAIIGVNSFGFGGTNAHVILEEYPDTDNKENGKASYEENGQILTISAKSENARKNLAESYIDYLSNTDEKVENICYNANTKREKLKYGLAVTGKTKEEMVEELKKFVAGENSQGYAIGVEHKDNRLVFVYTGMGPQWFGMGVELYKSNEVFRQWVDKMDKVFSEHLSWSIVEEMMADEEHSHIERTDVAQPMNFVIQVALTELLKTMGIVPDVIIGHSVGEVSAFYEAGVYSLEEAAKVSVIRSRCQQKLTGKGTMLAVGLSEQDVQEYIVGMEDTVSIGAINSHTSVTLSGKKESLEKVASILQEKKIFAKFLRVNIPYHSIFMKEIKEELIEALKDLHPSQSKIKLYTTAEGEISDGTDLNNMYWWKNVSNSVHFSKAMFQILEEGYSNLIEIGPHPVLGNSIRELAEELDREVLVCPSIRRKEPEMPCLLQTYKLIYCAGYPVKWDMVYEGEFSKAGLPTYAWEHKRFWREAPEHMRKRLGQKDHPLLGYHMNIPFAIWNCEINDFVLPYVKDHCINGRALLAGAQMIETAFQVLKQLSDNKEAKQSYSLYNIEFKKALFLDENNTTKISIKYDQETGHVEIYSGKEKNYKNATIHFCSLLKRRQPVVDKTCYSLDDLKANCSKIMQQEDCYAFFEKLGFSYGPMFHGLQQAWIGKEHVMAMLKTEEEIGVENRGYVISPVILDAAFQAMILNQYAEEDDLSELKLPVSIGSVTVYGDLQGRLYVDAIVKENTPKQIIGDINIYNTDGKLVAKVTDFVGRVFENSEEDTLLSEKELNEQFYKIVWSKREKEEDEPVIAHEEECQQWLIIGKEQTYINQLAKLFEEAGATCRIISNVHDLDYAQLDKSQKYGIVFMNSIDIPFQGKEMNCQDIEAAKTEMLNPFREIMQDLTQTGVNFKMWLVTKNAVEVVDTDEINLNQAAAFGIGRIVGQNEFISNWGANIDMDDSRDSVQMLYNDLTEPSREGEIAYRNGERYTSRLVHLRTMNGTLPVFLDKEKYYIVSGGLGSLGQITVDWMFNKGARKFILLGRTIPEGNTPSDKQRLEFVNNLEQKGAQVELYAIDIKDEKLVAEFASKCHSREGVKIGGIFHIAGIIRDQLLMQMTQEEFDAVYDPKAMGAWNLSKYFWDDNLEFFLTYSSTGAVVTSVGQYNYAAGNAFMDALAHYRCSQGRPGQSIGWGPWAVGMVKEKNLIDHYKYVRGMAPIYPKSGMQALERILGQNEEHVVMCGSNWPLALTNYPGKPTLFNYLAVEMEENNSTDEEVDILDTIADMDEKEQFDTTADILRKMVADIIYTPSENIYIEEGLNTIGVDSIIATEIRNKISKTFDVMVPISDIIGGASIKDITQTILTELQKRLAERQDEMEEMLANIENLSDEEIEKLLNN